MRAMRVVHAVGVARVARVAMVAMASMTWMLQGQQPVASVAAKDIQGSPYFIGNVTPVEDKLAAQTSHYHFDAGARTKWHSHGGGQLILVEEGVTHYQVKGGPVRELRVNETYFVQPGVVHWHGGTPSSGTTQFNVARGDLVWLDDVTDQQFRAKAKH
jgi:quercetin dioxygenase-like cupin family protein